MNRPLVAAFLIACAILSNVAARASTIVPVSQQMTVDSDGDGVVDLLDNAPGTSNLSQEDTDMDQIGDAIDPTPSTSVPNLGDPFLGIAPALSITAGSNANFDYILMNAAPPGAWGHIDLDFDQDTVTDAVFFGPLTTSFNSMSIPASLYVGASWDLYTPGTYTVAMKAYGPGMSSLYWALPNITVLPVPEPSSLMLAGLGAAAVAIAWRRRSSC